MKPTELTKHFAKMGAELTIRQAPSLSRPLVLDVRRTHGREHFDLAVNGEVVNLQVLQVVPKDRHLLLYTGRDRLLCGHDERHWFVAAIAGSAKTVREAKASLLPTILESPLKSIRTRERMRRRNKIFKRQGEWIFVGLTEERNRALDLLPVHRNEPIQRGRLSKPHICSELVRERGTTVYIVDGREYLKYEDVPTVHRQVAVQRVRDIKVYVRGTVRHPDHATLRLSDWHEVLMNTEQASAFNVFYD